MEPALSHYSCPKCGLHVLIPSSVEPGVCECPTHPQFVRDEPPDAPGARARWQRERIRRSLGSVAQEAGISKGFLCEWEMGKKDMTLTRVAAVARAIHVTLDWLVGGSV